MVTETPITLLGKRTSQTLLAGEADVVTMT